MGVAVAHCFFCGQPGAAGGQCATCLVSIAAHEGSIPPVTHACPRCAVPLTPIGITPEATLHTCARCRGMFVGPRAWSVVATAPAIARTIAAKLPAGGRSPAELLPLVRCPSCAREMERGRWGASSTVVVDVCVAHGLWLDAGEIVAVAEHAALRSRVGATAARQATNARESQPIDAVRLVADAASDARLEVAARRTRVVKRSGLFLLLAVVVLRLGIYVFGRGPGAAAIPPEQVVKGGQSAASAASALGGR